MHVLAIGAHPDDVEISCAGTLARCKQRGDTIHICVVTDGRYGRGKPSSQEIVETRYAEASAAAEMLDARFYWLGVPDCSWAIDDDIRLRLVEIIRKASPDLIITHGPEDYHPDHMTVAQVAKDASFAATVGGIETKSQALSLVPQLFVMEPLMGVGFQPEIWVDITDTFSKKHDMLIKHVSQYLTGSEGEAIDMRDLIKTVARFRGLQSGVKYAESFREWRVWPRVRAKSVLL
jgi:LmbE family N-acetylglucosaminyl deacetylase